MGIDVILNVGCCEHGNEPFSSIKEGNFLNNRATVSFSTKTLLYGVS
jgi:hypothetical protein